MKRTSIALLLLSIATAGCAQSDAESILSLGQSLDGTLESDGQDEYVADLPSGSFVYGEVDQIDVDVAVTVLDPNGDIIGSFNGSARGADPLQLETKTEGRYTFRIEPYEEQSGSYRISLQRIEPVATDPAERLDQLLSAYAGNDTPGAIVAVMRDGKIVHNQAVGMANLTFDIPFDRETVSNIGSVSKQFTAFAVAKLAADGALSLDDDVRTHFPELPDLGHTVTVRQILNHSSGYREFLNLLYMAGVRLDNGDYIDRDEVLRILERQPALQDEPGTRFNYNNTAYSLASLLVEKVTETPFQEWMAANVFEPLGMHNTRIRAHTGEIIPNAAEGYSYADDAPYRISIDLGGGGEATMGPGGVYTTVDDLEKWINNFHTGAVGGAEVIAELMHPSIEVPGEESFYGLGLDIDQHRGRLRIGHGGADTAHRAHLLFYPEFNAGVVALSNNASFPAFTTALKTAEAFFDADLEPVPEADTEAVTDASASGADNNVDIASFDPFVGQYEFDDYPGVVIIISRDEENVYVQSPGDDKEAVSPLSPTSLSLPPDRSIVFNVEEDGTANSLTIKSETDLVATRLEEWSPAMDDLAEFTGRYFSEELDTVYSVEMGDEGLIIRHRRLDEIKLIPKVEDAFNATNALSEVVFARDEDGALTGMMGSNVRTLNVWFEKQD